MTVLTKYLGPPQSRLGMLTSFFRKKRTIINRFYFISVRSILGFEKMQLSVYLAIPLLAVALILVNPTDAWWLIGENGNSDQCPERDSATPYFFGTTDVSCIYRNGKRKRSAPSRGTLEWVHRFIYYKGFYFEFFDNSKAYIGTQRQFANVCTGGLETSPAGYSELDVDCIKGCARNYRCQFGSFGILSNNCHDFTNELSEVLCSRGQSCPAWCLGDCNHAVERN